MENIIVVFPKDEDAKKIRNLLVKNGLNVDAVCTSGAQALEYLNIFNEGILICSYRLQDMYYTGLNEMLPDHFEMLLLASKGHWMEENGKKVMKLGTPVKTFDLINTIHMMFEAQARRRKKERLVPKVRTEEEKGIIKQAKGLLMDRNHMTEDEAHKYLQKCSMDSGNSLVESAEMVICLYRT